MARLTRAESRERTRAELIETARDLFLSDGYATTTLDRVAEEAGYSKGAVYSNFANKNELGMAVLDLIHQSKAAELVELVGDGESLEHQLDRLEQWAERTVGDVGWTTLEFELSVAARHDPVLRSALAEGLHAVRSLTAGILESLADAHGLVLPIPAEHAASAILSVGIGLGMQRAIDPSIPIEPLVSSARILLATAVPRA